MNWRQGLFRLWIYISAIWTAIVIVAAITAAIQLAQLPTTDEFFGCNAHARPHFCGAAPPSISFARQIAWFVGYWSGFVAKYLLWAIVPSATVFAFGRGILWVIDGFKRPIRLRE